jgi:hypothetical protein
MHFVCLAVRGRHDPVSVGVKINPRSRRYNLHHLNEQTIGRIKLHSSDFEEDLFTAFPGQAGTELIVESLIRV